MTAASPFDLTGRVALVTGAARGLGHAMATALSHAGATVIFNGRDRDALEAARGALASAGRKTDVAVFDVTDAAAVVAGVAALERKHGALDIVINNAGIQRRNAVHAFEKADWDAVIATNLTGAANVCRAVLPGMVERRRGRIVNVSSVHGMRGDSNLAAHSAAKFGLIGLTQSLAREFRGHNIAVNAVSPGTVENRIDETGAADRQSPLAEKLWPRDVAKAVLFLASNDAAAITGSTIEVFGGTHLVIQP